MEDFWHNLPLADGEKAATTKTLKNTIYNT